MALCFPSYQHLFFSLSSTFPAQEEKKGLSKILSYLKNKQTREYNLFKKEFISKKSITTFSHFRQFIVMVIDVLFQTHLRISILINNLLIYKQILLLRYTDMLAGKKNAEGKWLCLYVSKLTSYVTEKGLLIFFETSRGHTKAIKTNLV